MRISISQFNYEFIPAEEKTNKVLIVLHGKGDTLIPFRDFQKELGVRDFHLLLLNAPKKFMGGYSWYNEPPKMRSEILDIRLKVLWTLKELMDQGIASEDIFLLGFSQGCLVSADVALAFKGKLGGVIGISGYFHFFPRWQNSQTKASLQTPWLFTHGYQDQTLPIQTTRFGIRKLKEAGFAVQSYEFNKGHVFQDKEYPWIKKWLQEKSSVKYPRNDSVRDSESWRKLPASLPSVAFEQSAEKSQPLENREN
jgi:phospholipase/carboxylesterase